MKITDFYWRKFYTDFKRPFRNSGQVYNIREGFYLFAEFDNSFTCTGECSPLPGVNIESTGDAALELEQIQNEVLSFNSEDYKDCPEFINNVTPLSSVRCALTGLFTDAFQKDINKQYFVPLNGVVSNETPDNVIREVEKLYSHGYKVIKIKTGKGYIPEDINLVHLIFDKFPDIKLRIDPNSAYNFNEAVEFIDSVKECNIDYIEDPVDNEKDMIKLAEFSPVSVAADIFIRSIDDIIRFSENSKIKHFVIKPQAFADIACLPDYKFEPDIKITISSAFETIAGRYFLYQLASRFDGVHGISTAGFLDEQLTGCPINEDSSVIKFDKETFQTWFTNNLIL